MQDEVEKPGHYQFGQMEAWDIIELAVMDTADPVTAYHVASALKYLLRAARKGGDTDIAKASAHLKREAARHATATPDYDPASVAFRHGDLDKVCGDGAVAEERTYRIGGHPSRTAAEIVHADGASAYGLPGSGRNLPNSAIELADADGCAEYGNPVTPGCATPARQSDSWGFSYGGKRP